MSAGQCRFARPARRRQAGELLGSGAYDARQKPGRESPVRVGASLAVNIPRHHVGAV